MESVESRQMLSGSNDVTFNAASTTSAVTVHVSKTGTLHITGTDQADKITVGYVKVYGGGSSATTGVYVSRNGDIAGTFVTNAVKRVSVQGGAGRDIVKVDLKKTVAGRLVGGKGKDVLIVVNAPVNTAVYPFKTDPATIPVKGLITAYPIAEATDAEKGVDDPDSGVNAFTHAGTKNPDLQDATRESLAGGEASFTTGFQRAWAGKVTPSRPAQLVDHGVYDASLINDLLFYGEDALTPSERPTSIVVTESDGSATAYLYDPTTDKVTVGVEQHFKIHFIDASGNEVSEAIKGQGYLWKMAVPDAV
jgi:hypothetical protein